MVATLSASSAQPNMERAQVPPGITVMPEMPTSAPPHMQPPPLPPGGLTAIAEAPQVSMEKVSAPNGDMPRSTMPPPIGAPQPRQQEEGVSSGPVSSSSASSSEAENSSSSDSEGYVDETSPPVLPVRLKILKLGKHCCNAVARFAGGHDRPDKFPTTLEINQRVKVDTCKDHMAWAADLVTVWRISALDKSGRAAYGALAEYFLEKQRLGVAESRKFSIYIVPPSQSYHKELGLASSNHILGIQVPKPTK